MCEEKAFLDVTFADANLDGEPIKMSKVTRERFDQMKKTDYSGIETDERVLVVI